MTNIEIYDKPEKFRYGWVAGFYDARSDDGLRYGLGSGDDEVFLAGYRAGRQARLGQPTAVPATRRTVPEPFRTKLRRLIGVLRARREGVQYGGH